MADLLSSWGGTDSGTYSPDVIARRAKIAQALLEQATQQQPIQHWTQGLAQMSRALLGGIALNKADTLQNTGDAQFRSDLSRVFSPDGAGPTPQATPPGAVPAPSPAAAPPMPPGAGASVAPSLDSSLPRGMRNNNPLNIEAGPFTQRQAGFSGSDGRFAKFETPDQGITAASNLLDVYNRKYGINTVNGVVGRWAPKDSDNNPTPAYAAFVARKLGVSPDSPLDMSDPQIKTALVSAMGEFENGRPLASQAPPSGPPPTGIAQALQATGGAGIGGPGAIAQALAPPQGGPPAAVPPGAGVMAPPTAAPPPGAPMGASAGGAPPPIMGPPSGSAPAAPPAPSARPEVTPDRRAAIAQLLANPRTPPGIAAMLAGQLNTQFGFQTLPDGRVIRTDPNRGTVDVAYDAPKPPQFVVIGKDTNGNDIHGFVDPVKKTIIPVNAQGQVGPGAAANSGPNASLTGKDYLSTLDPGRANMVQAILDGRMAPPGSFALKSPQILGLMRDAAQVEPGFDLTSWKARDATRTDMAKGKMGQNITSFNTAIGHLDTLSKAADDLGNSWNPTYNTIGNWLNVQKGNPQVTQFNTAKNAVIDELTRAFRGTGGNVHDLVQWEQSINSSASPEQLKTAVRQATELLRSRIEAIGDQYSRGMGKTTDALDLLSPRAKTALQKLSGEAGPAPAPPQSAAPPVAAAPAASTKVQTPDEAAKLAPGTRYMTPDGQEFIR